MSEERNLSSKDLPPGIIAEVDQLTAHLAQALRERVVAGNHVDPCRTEVVITLGDGLAEAVVSTSQPGRWDSECLQVERIMLVKAGGARDLLSPE